MAHSVLSGLRASREPRGRTLEVVRCLCQHHPQEGHTLPSDAEIGQALGMSFSTVRKHLERAGQWIDGLESLEVRSRIYLWYWNKQFGEGK